MLAADAAGYSQRMEADEVGTLAELRVSREIFIKFIERHQGRVANTAGDGLIAEFPSVVEAAQCAIEVQRELATMPHEYEQSRFRIGIHLGDVIVDGQNLLGEGVNLAARLQTMAEPGGILIPQQVFDQMRSKLTVGFDYLGKSAPRIIPKMCRFTAFLVKARSIRSSLLDSQYPQNLEQHLLHDKTQRSHPMSQRAFCGMPKLQVLFWALIWKVAIK